MPAQLNVAQKLLAELWQGLKVVGTALLNASSAESYNRQYYYSWSFARVLEESPAQPNPMPALMLVVVATNSRGVLAFGSLLESKYSSKMDDLMGRREASRLCLLRLLSTSRKVLFARKLAGSRVVRLVGKERMNAQQLISFEKSVGDGGSCPQEFPLGTNERYAAALDTRQADKNVSCRTQYSAAFMRYEVYRSWLLRRGPSLRL
jgi:hypothetical protein